MIIFISEQRNIHDGRLVEQLSLVTKVFWQPDSTLKNLTNLPKKAHTILVSPTNSYLLGAMKNRYKNIPIYLLSYAQEILEAYEHPNTPSMANLKSNLLLCDGVIVDCHKLADILRKDFDFKGRLLKTTYFWRDEFQQSTSSKNRLDAIGTNRTFTPVHNNKLLFDSLNEIDEISQFYFIAQGEEVERVFNEQIKSTFFGKKCVPMNFNLDQTQFFSMIGIYVSASVYDGTSVSLLEAMLSGKICVVPDIPCNKEVIQHGVNGFLYTRNSKSSLIEVMKIAISLEESERKRIEKRAIATAKKVTDSKKNIAEIMEFFNHISA